MSVKLDVLEDALEVLMVQLNAEKAAAEVACKQQAAAVDSAARAIEIATEELEGARKRFVRENAKLNEAEAQLSVLTKRFADAAATKVKQLIDE